MLILTRQMTQFLWYIHTGLKNAVPYCRRVSAVMKHHLLSEWKASRVLLHALCCPLIQYFSSVLSKNTWHLQESKANSQTKTEPVSLQWDGVIPGHLLVSRPQRWACGEESMAVYFGRCLSLRRHLAQNSRNWLKAVTEIKETLQAGKLSYYFVLYRFFTFAHMHT